MRFVAVSEQGPSWDRSRGMREQEYWADHAAFIDGLIEEGFLLLEDRSPMAVWPTTTPHLSDPVRDARLYRAMVVVDAPSRDEAARRMRADPWAQHGLLRTTSIDRWELLVGELPQQTESPDIRPA